MEKGGRVSHPAPFVDWDSSAQAAPAYAPTSIPSSTTSNSGFVHVIVKCLQSSKGVVDHFDPHALSAGSVPLPVVSVGATITAFPASDCTRESRNRGTQDGSKWVGFLTQFGCNHPVTAGGRIS